MGMSVVPVVVVRVEGVGDEVEKDVPEEPSRGEPQKGLQERNLGVAVPPQRNKHEDDDGSCSNERRGNDCEKRVGEKY